MRIMTMPSEIAFFGTPDTRVEVFPTPGYGTLILRASVLLGDKLDVSAFMINATDQEYSVSGLVSGNLNPAAVGEPRMYGAEVTYKF